MSAPVLINIADGIATLTMNRPDAFNALDAGLMNAFADGIGQCSVDPHVRAIIVTGAGKAFDAPIAADQALAWGLATEVVAPDQVLATANEMARAIARGSLHSYGVAKCLLTDSLDTSFETQLERERKGLTTCVAHTDVQEGLRAFAEKRKPQFS